MNNISSDLLSQTLSIIQLARESAIAQGKTSQVTRLAPLADNLESVVQAKAASHPVAPAAPAGILAQNDFKAMLAAIQASDETPAPEPAGQAPVMHSSAIASRNQMILAMSSASMSDVDIARQFGITREEVSLVLGIRQNSKTIQGA